MKWDEDGNNNESTATLQDQINPEDSKLSELLMDDQVEQDIFDEELERLKKECEKEE